MPTVAELIETRRTLDAQARNMAYAPDVLGSFIKRSMDVAVATLYASRDGAVSTLPLDAPGESRVDSAREWIRRSARASALLLGRLAFPKSTPPIELADGVPITWLASAPDPQQVSVEGWVDAMFRAMVVSDDVCSAGSPNIPRGFLETAARRNGERVQPYLPTLGALPRRSRSATDGTPRCWSAR